MKSDNLDRPYLAPLISMWGMDKLEVVSRYPRSAIYQWKPSRGLVPPEAALRISEFAEHLGFYVERMCPGLPWHLLYRGRDRRAGYDGLDGPEVIENIDEVVKSIGVTNVARAADRSRQNVYEAIKSDKCPVWLVLAVEKASGQRFLVEDFRPELPWWPLYNRKTKVYPVKARSE